jgi:hypothetical protein
MEQYRRRLERTQIKICVLLLVLLFGGLLTLPWIGQVIWIAIIMAIHIRLIFVIARKEELLEELDPRGKTIKSSAWYDSRRRHVVISDSDLRIDAPPKKCIEIKPTLPQNSAHPSQKSRAEEATIRARNAGADPGKFLSWIRQRRIWTSEHSGPRI